MLCIPTALEIARPGRCTSTSKTRLAATALNMPAGAFCKCPLHPVKQLLPASLSLDHCRLPEGQDVIARVTRRQTRTGVLCFISTLIRLRETIHLRHSTSRHPLSCLQPMRTHEHMYIQLYASSLSPSLRLNAPAAFVAKIGVMCGDYETGERKHTKAALYLGVGTA